MHIYLHSTGKLGDFSKGTGRPACAASAPKRPHMGFKKLSSKVSAPSFLLQWLPKASSTNLYSNAEVDGVYAQWPLKCEFVSMMILGRSALKDAFPT